MKTKAVLLDKDGTLMEFDAFWRTASYGALEDLLRGLGGDLSAVGELLSALGVGNGATDITGALCCGTYKDMGQALYGVLKERGGNWTLEEITRRTEEAYHRHISDGIIRPDCAGAVETLRKLKTRGIKLAVVTTDQAAATQQCLQALGMTELFDAVYTDDGHYPAKPDPYCALDFCRREGLQAEEAVMVGDTLTDMRFARNAGIRAIGIAKTERNREILSAWTDAVVRDISRLLEVLP